MAFLRIDHSWLEKASRCRTIDEFQNLKDEMVNADEKISPLDYFCQQMKEATTVLKKDNFKAVNLSPGDRKVLAKISAAAQKILLIEEIGDYAAEQFSKAELANFTHQRVSEENSTNRSPSVVPDGSQGVSGSALVNQEVDNDQVIKTLTGKKSGIGRFSRLTETFAESDLSEHKSCIDKAKKIVARDPRLANIYCDFLERATHINPMQKLEDLNTFYYLLDENSVLFFNFLDKHVSNKDVHFFVSLVAKLPAETVYKLIRLGRDEGLASLDPLMYIIQLLRADKSEKLRYSELVYNRQFLTDFFHLMSAFAMIKNEVQSYFSALVNSLFHSELSAEWVERVVRVACGNPETALLFLENLKGANREKLEKVINSLYIYRSQGCNDFCQGVADIFVIFKDSERALKYAQTLIDIFLNHPPIVADTCLDLFREGHISSFQKVMEEFPNLDSTLGKTLKNCLLSDSPISAKYLDLLIKSENSKVVDLFGSSGMNGIKLSLLRVLQRGNNQFAGKIMNLFKPDTTSKDMVTPKEKAILSLLEAGEVELAELLDKRDNQKLDAMLAIIPFSNPEEVRQIIMIFRDLEAIGNADFAPHPPLRGVAEDFKSYLPRLKNYFTNLQIALIQPDTQSSVQLSQITAQDPAPVFDKIFKMRAREELGLKRLIIRCLMTPSGEIPPALVNMLQANSDFIRRLQSQPEDERDQINTFLNAVKDSAHITTRIGAISPPLTRSGQEICKTLFDDKKPRLSKVYEQIFESLMTPTHQVMGNCFAVATIRQQGSSINGLQQITEDYVSIINKGYLEFVVENGPVAIPNRFPVIIPKEYFSAGNVPSRLNMAREVTMASIGGGSVRERFIQASMGYVENVALKLLSNEKNQGEVDIHNRITSRFCHWLQANLSVIFEPTSSEFTSHRWRFYAGEILLDVPEKLEEFYFKGLILSLKELDNYVDIVPESVRQIIGEQSNELLNNILSTIGEDEAGTAFFVEMLYSKNPVIGQNVYGSFIWGEKDMLQKLLRNNIRLPGELRRTIRTNTRTKLGLEVPGHMCSYFPGSIELIMGNNMDPYENIRSHYSADRDCPLDLKARHILFDQLRKEITPEFYNSELVKNKLMATKQVSAGAFWEDFKACVDLWDFDINGRRKIKNALHILLLTLTKANSLPVLDIHNQGDIRTECLWGFDRELILVRKYKHPNGSKIFLEYEIPKFIGAALQAYCPDEINMNVYTEDK